MSLIKRVKFLERIIAKLPPLAIQCDRLPSHEQIAQIDRAEAIGRRVILFMRLPSTIWINGEDKPWESELCD